MLSSYAVTDIGRTRRVNQDYVFSSMEPIGNLPNLFIVADGMGGHQAGDFASSYSVKKFLESVSLSLQKNPGIHTQHTLHPNPCGTAHNQDTA